MQLNPSASFGDLLKRFRLAAGLSQEALAERAGLSPRGVSDLERGARTNPRPGTVRLLADALALTQDERASFLAVAQGSISSLRSRPDTPVPPGAHSLADREGILRSQDSLSRKDVAERIPPPVPAVRTFLIADIRGYTQFTAEHSDEATARLLTRFAMLAREVVEAYDGRVVELRGDEVLAIFASSRQALRAALGLQARLAEATQADPSLPLQVGIGLDAGEVLPVEDGYRGIALNLAARLCSIAVAGEVLASEEIVHLARKVEGLVYEDRGTAQFRGFADHVRVFRIVDVRDHSREHADASAGRMVDTQSATAEVETTRTAPVEPALPVGGVQGGEPDDPLVAREAEIQQLAGTLAAVAAGSGRLVLLAGEPGIGKTRLAEEVTLIAQRQGMLVLWGRCYEGAGAPAFWPWMQLLRAYMHQRSLRELEVVLGTGAGVIAQLAPDIRARLPQTPEPLPLEPEPARFRLFENMTQFLLRAARQQPLVLVLDDLHWADEASVLLLEFLALAREMRNTPLLIVGCYRDTDVGPRHPFARTLGILARESHVQRLALRGFTAAEVGRFIAAAIGRRVPEPLVAAIAHETEGNPFFVTQVVRLLASEGLLEPEDVLRPGSDRVLVPQTVREAIALRLDRLSAACNSVLTTAAVIGREFRLAVLAQALDLAPEALLDALAEAETARIILAQPEPGGVDRYRFVHVLVRESLYDAIPTSQRMRLHRLVGEAIETVYGPLPDAHLAELAHHFGYAAPAGTAETAEKAVAYAWQAGDQATAQLAYEEAVRLYQQAWQALAQQPQHPTARQHGDLLLAVAEAYTRAGVPAAAKATYQYTRELARQLNAADLLARAALGFGGPWVMMGVVDHVLIAWLEEALQALEAAHTALRARVMARLAMELYFAGPATDARRDVLSKQAVDLAQQVGEGATLAYVLNARHWALYGPDNAEERLAAATAMVQLAEQLGDQQLLLEGLHWRSSDLLELGEVLEAEQAIATQTRLAEALQLPFPLWQSLLRRALWALLVGEWTAADQCATQALTYGQRGAQDLTAAGVYLVQLFFLRREQGRLAELITPVRDMAEVVPHFSAWRCFLAGIFADIGHQDEARHEFDAIAAQDFAQIPKNYAWPGSISLLAEVCAILGDTRRAALLYELLLPYARHHVLVGRTSACSGSFSSYLGLLAATLGRWDEATHHFADALNMNTRLGARPWIARTQYHYAAMLLSRGQPRDREQAWELLEHALATTQALGMPRLAEQIRALRERTSLAPLSLDELAPEGTATSAWTQGTRETRPDKLTAREVEVLQLLASGHYNREIADALVVSIHTVERHVVNIYHKIGVRGRTEATAYALRHRLVAAHLPTPPQTS